MFLKIKQLIRLNVTSSYRCAMFYSNQNSKISATDARISISENCVKQLKQLGCEGSNAFLRLCVESGGCSGFQYKFDLDDKIADDDRIFEQDGVKVVIDETSLEYIKGSTVDYHTELIRSAFRVIQNPNAELGCSCGASFSVKID
ncbi:unnamed protein product [Diatraea saccharalis]|uniref:Iron-sulfur cluster assembly 2 homolog, mitochondrial n=1 Tax=Diatraea saccharalis TaxID=40085 RepID=A0A9N9R3L6_9NEOP|nr:unnamed protein product [Diatraea saccharalis]